ncbi:MAG: hypothetical protein ACOVQ0_14800, partial [Novosphingobium sp.]|uniref:hypothetical protein n=1 Tax=Novosphingobium sp. TaxID=1874826 RepID=UPI003B9D04C8
KKDPAVARRVGKFWERMPERQDLYAPHTGFVQLRNDQTWLHFLQFSLQVFDLRHLYACFIRNDTNPFRSQWIAQIGFESG